MNKILQQFRIFIVPALFIFNHVNCFAQNRYGVNVIENKNAYKRSILQDSSKKMVELKSVIPDIVYDLRYATTNNFMRRRMYKGNFQTFLRRPAAEALSKVQQELKTKGFALKIFDAYRPYSVTVKFWELVKDEKYVANPAKGSAHNRGLAVDVTLIDINTKNELDMGTGFDNFTDTAHHSFRNLAPGVTRNRSLLRETMSKYGFTIFDTEWWHYSWPNTVDYELLDIKL